MKRWIAGLLYGELAGILSKLAVATGSGRLLRYAEMALLASCATTPTRGKFSILSNAERAEFMRYLEEKHG